jgi:pilus assembly protein CpaC
MRGVWLFSLILMACLPLAGARAEPVEILPGSATEITLPVSQGRILRFDGPVESVVLSDPSIADLRIVSDDVIYIYGTKSGTTDLVAMTADKKIKTALKLDVVNSSESPDQASRELRLATAPDINFFGERAVVMGTARNVDDAIDMNSVGEAYAKKDEPLLNAGEFNGANQVNIRVRFAEVSRNGLEALGINWSVVAGAGNFSFGLVKRNDLASGNGIGGSFGSGSKINIDVLVDALKRNGVLTVLAEPNLTAVTGETASFLAGGEIPVPIPQDRDRIGVEYKPFGVSLLFTPTLLKNGRIGLRIRPEVSTVSSAGAVQLSGFSLPAFTVRRADTTVEAASGQTFAIAGLFQRNMSQEMSKFPILGDVPILGNLFRSQRYQRDETELVILITPYLVEPVSDKLATPADRATLVQEASAVEAAPAPRAPRKKSPYGLVVK